MLEPVEPPDALEAAAQTAAEIRSSFRLLVIATIVLYLAIFALAGKGYHDSGQITDALCALRSDLDRRVTASNEFLADNPNGVPGIPAQLIKDGIANQQRTIAALKNISC